MHMHMQRQYLHKFSLSKLIQRAHAKITLDPTEPQQLYHRLTSDFRQQLNHNHVHHLNGLDKSIATTVAKLHLADHRHVRLVNLLTSSSSSCSSNSVPVPVIHTGATSALLPDLYTALTHVPNADPSDYALAISLTTQHAPSRAFALHESHKIYQLYLTRQASRGHRALGLDPHLDDALDPLTQLVRTYLIHGHTRDALDLLDPLLTTPASSSTALSTFYTWLNTPPSDPSKSSRYASALHLFTQSMQGLRLAGDLDLAAHVYRAAQRLLRMDLLFAFEPRPPYTSAPAPAADQSALIMHLAATLDADRARAIWRATAGPTRRPRAKLHLTPRAYAALWHVLTLGGFVHDGYRVFVDRMVGGAGGRGATLDARVASAVVGELFAPGAVQDAAQVAMPTLDRLLRTWPALRLADHAWVAVFHAVDQAYFAATTKWWVPVSRMASVDDPTRTVRTMTNSTHDVPTYLEQVVNLYTAYVQRTPNASPAASVGSAFVDRVVAVMVDEGVQEDKVRRVLEAWLTVKETERVMGWIRARRGRGGIADPEGLSVSSSASLSPA